MISKRYRVLPYKQGSASAKSLATALGGKVLKLEGSKFIPKTGDVVINWGNSNVTESFGATYNANAEALRNATNKKSFFETMKEKCPDVIPQFWTDKEDIPDDAYPVVCRTILSGHSGAGIHIADAPDDLVSAPLYVRYIKKKDEYRIHLGKKGDTSIIAAQRKARSYGHGTPNWQIRNHANGFIYVRANVNPPHAVVKAATDAFEATGLDFGAVDVIWNNQTEKAYVLEINTAPGLEGQTVTDYATFFKEGVNEVTAV